MLCCVSAIIAHHLTTEDCSVCRILFDAIDRPADFRPLLTGVDALRVLFAELADDWLIPNLPLVKR